MNNRFCKHINTSGLTLIELLIALSIASMVGVLLMGVLVQNNGTFYLQQTRVNQGLGLNDTISTLSNDLKSANAIAVSYPLQNPQVISGANAIVLALNSLDSQGNVIDNTYDYLTILQDPFDPKILKRQLYPDPLSSRKAVAQTLLTNLSTLTFTYLDKNESIVSPTSATKIKFALTVSDRIGVNFEDETIDGEVNLRNN